MNLNLDNQTTEQLEKKYFQLLEIQAELREFQEELEKRIFPEFSLPF